jgi:pimeloyl-ACP methyl ester carboxylesterase
MGLAASRFWWPPGFVDALLARGFHVVAYDQRDAGQSTHLDGAPGGSPFATLFRRRATAYSVEDMTDDAVAVLDAVGWRSAVLFGHSMGGALVQAAALRHPERVHAIAVSGAVPLGTGPLGVLRHVRFGVPLRMARMRFPAGPDGDVGLALALGRLLASPGYPYDESVTRGAVERDLAHGVTGFRDLRAQSRQTGAKWHGGRLADLAVPALVLHGDADPIVRPSAARATAAAIPGARLVTFPGLGHDLPRELWAGYADHLRALADRAG